jgi:CheY-like chemotaxis protein
LAKSRKYYDHGNTDGEPVSNKPSAPQDHPLILAVDDDASERALVERALIKNGYTVLTAETGELALRIMEKIVPTVVVVDVSLPGMSGYDLCLALKADPRLKNIPIVFLSGRDLPRDFQMGREAGGVFYIPKSSSLENLLTAVRMLCGARQSRPSSILSSLQRPELGAKDGAVTETMIHDFDIFEKSPDGTVAWREVVSGLEPAIARMKALASNSTNEFVLLHSATNRIVERAKVSESR